MLLNNDENFKLNKDESITIISDDYTDKIEPKLIENILSDYKTSKFYMDSLTARKYYYNNADINNKKRYIIGKGGVREIASFLSNSKMQHNFLYKQIKQKRSFLLGKAFTVNAPDEISDYCNIDKKTRDTIKSVSTDAMLYGIGWMQKYYDEYGNIRVKKIPSLEITPLWEDVEHTRLNAIIREYIITQYNENGKKEDVKKVELYDKYGVWKYVYSSNGLVPDNDTREDIPNPHFYSENVTIDDDGKEVINTEGMLFNSIPFIFIKYNVDEVPLLNLIKSGIDEYNNKTSLLADELQDILTNITKVKGYSGNNAEEFIHNLNTLRTIFVGENGDVDTIKNDIDVQAFESFLNQTKENIYDMGMCVNTQAENLKSTSGIALKLRYSDLVLDCSEFGVEVEKAIIEIIKSKLEDFEAKGVALGEYDIDDIKVVFNMDLPTDESEIITNAKNSVGVISDKTIIANHPWVTDVDTEIKQITEEEKAQEYDVYNDVHEHSENTENSEDTDDTDDTDDTEIIDDNVEG